MAETGRDPLSRAEELAERADRRVGDLRDDVDELGDLLVADGPAARGRALRAAVRLADAYPGDAVPLVDPLTDCLSEPTLQDDAALALGHVARGEPAAIADVLPALVSVLDDDGPVRANATYALAGVAAADPEALARRGVRRRTVELLGDEDSSVRTNATRILAEVARVDPDAICDHLAELGDGLSDQAVGVRRNAVTALGRVAATCPAGVDGHLDAVVSLLDDDDPGTRRAAAFALAYPTRVEGDAVAVAADALEARLDHDDVRIRRHATDGLWHLATEDPAAVGSAIGPLTRRLVDEDRAVRENAAGALDVLEPEFPNEVDAGRESLVVSLESVADGDDVDRFPVAGLRGLAESRTAPEAAVEAARRAVPIAELGGTPDSSADEDGDRSTASDSTGTDADSTVDESDDPDDSDPTVQFCSNCGESVEGGGKFCPSCGTSLG